MKNLSDRAARYIYHQSNKGHGLDRIVRKWAAAHPEGAFSIAEAERYLGAVAALCDKGVRLNWAIETAHKDEKPNLKVVKKESVASQIKAKVSKKK